MQADEEGGRSTDLTRRTFLGKGIAGTTALGLLGTTLAACGSAKSGTTAASGGGAGAVQRGGTLRLGLAGGSAKDLIDGQYMLSIIDGARLTTAFETLTTYSNDYKVTLDGLAEEVEATKPDASEWTVRIRDGIEFHDGKTLTADDVVFSLQRMVDPELRLSGFAALSTSLDPSGIKKIDPRTIRLTLKESNATIPELLAEYYNGIVPEGYKRYPGKQIGTGPYRLESFTPGERSVHVRNENYWRTGEPKLDEVVIISLRDETARMNALLSGQVDAITDVPVARVKELESHDGMAIMQSPPTAWTTFVMPIDRRPFDDVRVRQAFRLIADREQMLQQALSGYGEIGNDVFSNVDPAYASAGLPQREQDIEQAKSLLKAAGREGLSLELITWGGELGMDQAAAAFVEQAKSAGVTVKLKKQDATGFFATGYMEAPFFMTYWGTHSYLFQVSACMLPTSAFNETNWPPKGSNYLDLYKQALRTVDNDARDQILHEMMAIDYEQGGYLIPYYRSYIDGFTSKLQGLKPAVAQRFGAWDHGFRTIGFTA